MQVNKGKIMNKEHLYKIKQFEKQYEISIPKDKHIVIRIDGHKFSKLSKKYCNKPFDHDFSFAMAKTMERVFEEFQATFGYTQSDEITIILPAQPNKEGYIHPYNGRVQKLASLSASLASITFKHYFMRPIEEAWFDARVFSVPDEELVNVITERKRDAIRNSKSMFARAYASHKELLNKTANEQIEYVKEKYGKDWNDISDYFKFGAYIKKEQVPVYIGEEMREVIRNRNIIMPLKDYVTYEMIVSKYRS
jgi:tRNA(His) 5'-end guanylyltransferase